MNNGDEGFRIRNNFIPINNISILGYLFYNKNYCSACPIVEYFILPICPSLLIVSA